MITEMSRMIFHSIPSSSRKTEKKSTRMRVAIEESWPGDNWFLEIMMLQMTVKGTQEIDERLLQFKLISNTFYGGDTIQIEFLSDFSDMYINGSVAHNDIRSPYLMKNLISEKYFSGFGSQQGEQFEFFSG